MGDQRRGSAAVSGEVVFERTVEEAVRRAKLALQNDVSVAAAIAGAAADDAQIVLASRVFGARATAAVPASGSGVDAQSVFAALIFGRRDTAARHKLTFGTHLTGGSYDGSSDVTLATDATSANTASTIVARDASGNFSAGTISAALAGNASTATTAHGVDAQSTPMRIDNANAVSTIGAAGGASALPGAPAGYLRVSLSGVTFSIPYYNP